MFAHFDNLTPAQLDGTSCVVCADENGPMIPVGIVDGGQVFAHRRCAEPKPQPAVPTFAPILVLGEVGDEDARGELTTLAYDVTAELGRPTTIATSLEFDVHDFGAVVTFPGFLEDFRAATLWTEALEAGVPVIAPEIRREWLVCNACHKARLFGNVRTEWDENGWTLDETLCAPCDYRTPGCVWCLTADVPTVPVADGEGGWRPYCSPCAKAHTRRARRPRRTARKALVAA